MVSFGSSRTQGVIFSLCASCCTSSGLVIQKHAHNSGEWRLPMMQRWRWWIGLVGVIMGGCFDSMALGLAPLSNIAPLSGITILLNSLLASFFLGETIRVVEIVATVVIFAGATLTCIYGAHEEPPHSVDQLYDLFGQESFIYYFVVLVTLVAVALLSIKAVSGHAREQSLSPFLYAVVAAGLGGLEIILLKSVMEVLNTSLVGGQYHQFEETKTYGLIACLVVLAVAQLYSLNMGLAQCDAVRLLPVYQSLFIVNAVSGGACYFNEFKDFTAEQWKMFPLGVLIVVAGAMLLGMSPAPATPAPNFAELEQPKKQEDHGVAYSSVAVAV